MLRQVAIHDNFKNKGYWYYRLPEFDPLDQQHRGPASAPSFCHTSEIDRLLEILKDIDQTRIYKHRAQVESSSDMSQMDEVFHAARLIQSTLQIYMYDAAIIVIEHLRTYRSNSRTLQCLLEEANETAESSSRVLLRYAGSKFSRPQPPHAVEHLDSLTDVYSDMLDHISCQVLRLFSWSVESKEWEQSCVALMARMIAKLKLIGRDPKQWAVQSIQKGKSLESSVEISAQNYFSKNVHSDQTFTTQTSRSKYRRALIVDDVTPTVRYFKSMFKLRSFLTSIFQAVLGGICGSGASDFEAQKDLPSYEINNVVFANYEQPLWATFNNRAKRTVVTSEETILRICSAGWRLALRDMPSLPSPPPGQSGQDIATVDWQGDAGNGSNTRRDSGHFNIHCAADYVSVHVLVALSSVFVARPLRAMLALSAIYAEQDKFPVLYKYERFEMKFSVLTGKIGDESTQSHKDYIPLSGVRLPALGKQPASHESSVQASRGPILRSLRHLATSHAPESDSSSDLEAGRAADTPEDTSDRLWSQYSQWRAVMDTWEVDPGCIMIPCKGYVLTIMAAWVIVLVAGIVLLLVLRLRALGFDPSNILILVWTVASFAIVLAKSWFVENWTWNQFIQCQMPCRGVQELSRATGIPSQVLLLHLYRTTCSRASRTKLKTRGPYNGIFPIRGRDGTHGFAIDCAFKMETLVACGLLVLKVNGYDGTRLVCIGGRRELESAGWQSGAPSRGLVCRLPQQPEFSKTEEPELFFKEDYFVWQEGEGLYKNDRARFG